MKNNLTVVILTKNEEKNIEGAIENALLVTDRVLIVDSGSTDSTVEMAEKLGAKVVYRAWDNDFSAQRNFALEHVDTDWVLYLDADERMNDALVKAVKGATASNVQKKYVMVRKIKALGFEYKHGIFKPDKVTRMFPTKEVYWEHKVHERAVCELNSEVLAGWMDHYTYDSWQQWWEKAGKYTSIWAEDQYANGKRISVGSAFSHALCGFLKAYILQLGFLDGWGGVYSSILHVIYTTMKYLKLYELQNKGITL